MTHAHHYGTSCRWAGTTSQRSYSRRHEITSPDVPGALALSSDAVFGGDGALLNPEELLVAATSSCQLLSFLAVARQRGVDVVAYEDDARGELPKRAESMAISRIELRPTISVRGEVDEALLRELTDAAHHACFIANSLRSDVVVTPSFRHVV